MKRLFLLLAASALAFSASGQGPDDATAERARIQAERSRVEANFSAEEKACYSKFAVNDCLNEAKARRREGLADLRRQEISLNDADRKRRAAERERSLEERAARQKPATGGDQRAPRDAAGDRARDAQERAARSAGKAAERAAAQPERAADARERQQQAQLRKEAQAADQVRRAEEAARNMKRREEALAEAGERRANRDKRLADRKKSSAQPLPVPP